MNSEFSKVELDRIRYSLVWEDASTLYNALDIRSDDHVLVITSAGCNVLNVLLANPDKVTAIDINAEQNRLLRLKLHLISSFDYTTYRGLLGFDGTFAVNQAWRKVESTLNDDEKLFWTKFFKDYPAGILSAGKLEQYISRFLNTLPDKIRKQFDALLSTDSIEDQKKYFEKYLHSGDFKEHFIRYFDNANLSKGRDPKLFKYAQESGGKTFYERLHQQICTINVSENFFFRFFFFGPEGIPDRILPPCYQEQNFEILRDRIDKLILRHGEAVEFLLSAEARSVTKASLSNIFEYISEDEFNTVCESLFLQRTEALKIVFWNLLNEQGKIPKGDNLIYHICSETLDTTSACFYFKNVKIITSKI